MVHHVKPPLAAPPADLRSLADYAQRARDHMSAEAWHHIEEGCGAGETLRANAQSLARWRLLPRALADLRGGSTALTLLGQRHAAPILLGPVAYQRLVHPDGEIATARAAAATGTAMVVSTLASATLEAIAQASRQASAELGPELGVAEAPLWFQLYLQPTREESLALVRRAEAAGYGAIVLTIDAAIKLAGMALPAGVAAVNLAGQAPVRQQARLGGAAVFGTPLADAAPRWEDLAWLRAQTRLPLLVKGMALGEDARRMVDMGVDGLILSNHGGRVLDGLPPVLEVLSALRAVVGGLPVLVDGGFRRGTDVAKALALGADAVLLGRAQMHGLAVAGMAGVAHGLHLLRTELEMAMAALGCPTLADLGPDRVLPPA